LQRGVFYAFLSQWFSLQQTFPDLLFDLHIYADIYSFQSAISRQWMTGNLLKKRKKAAGNFPLLFHHHKILPVVFCRAGLWV